MTLFLQHFQLPKLVDLRFRGNKTMKAFDAIGRYEGLAVTTQ
jgi:hypothetical protein